MINEKSVFDFHDYKTFLRHRVGGKSSRRGLKAALAKALDCQPAYISRVINEHAHLSGEQGNALNEFFGHSKEEAHFFMLLLQKDRAGTQSLKKYYLEQMQEILDRRLVLTKRLGQQTKLSDEVKSIFYSSWQYMAIHIALTIPSFQTKEALAHHFHLPIKRVVSLLEFLVEHGLAKQVGQHFVAESSHIRIGNDSPLIVKHHTNWRLRAIDSLEGEDLNDLHYTAVVSLSAADVRVLKNMILENIKGYVATIRQSKEEEVRVICVDLFNPGERL